MSCFQIEFHKGAASVKNRAAHITPRFFPRSWPCDTNDVGPHVGEQHSREGKGPDRIYSMEWGHASPPIPGYLVGGPNASEMGMLAPGAPAKALLWDNPQPLSSGLPAHSLWHWEDSDLWDGGFAPKGQTDKGWWAVTEPDIYYNANLVLVAAEEQAD